MVEITGWQMVLSYVCEGTAGSELGMQRAASKIYEMINWWLEKESPVFVSMQLPLSKRLKFCQSSYE